MLIYNQFFLNPQDIHSLIYSWHPLHCLCDGNVFRLGGARIFSRGQRGGTKIFSRRQRGVQFFFTFAMEGTRKNWRLAITDRLPAKTDSSLGEPRRECCNPLEVRVSKIKNEKKKLHGTGSFKDQWLFSE